MIKYLVCVALFFIGVNLLCFPSYSLDDNERTVVRETVQAQNQRPTQPQQYQQQPNPVTQPIVPSSPVGIAPTPPPQIAMPPITTVQMNTPSSPFPQNPQPFIQTTLPSSPVQARMPIATNVQPQLPVVPVVGNSLGKVLEIGAEKDGTKWIKVRDDVFNETMKIKIDPKSTPVIKGAAKSSYSDIKAGDSVDVIFNQDGENITASFVSILTEEDLKAMEPGPKTESKDKPAPKQ